MKFEVLSNMLSVIQPDIYSMSELIDNEEQEAQREYDDERSTPSVLYKGQKTAPKDLPSPHKRYMPPATVGCDRDALLFDYTKQWTDNLRKYIALFYKEQKVRKSPIKIRHAGFDCPMQYNFEADRAVMEFCIDDDEWEHIIASAKKNKEQCNTFLYLAHGPRAGFRPFLPYDVQGVLQYCRHKNRFDKSKTYYARTRLMDWYLFGSRVVKQDKDNPIDLDNVIAVLDHNADVFANLFGSVEDREENKLELITENLKLIQEL